MILIFFDGFFMTFLMLLSYLIDHYWKKAHIKELKSLVNGLDSQIMTFMMVETHFGNITDRIDGLKYQK